MAWPMIAALASQAIGGVFSAYGNYKSSLEQSKAASYNALLAEQEMGLVESSTQMDLYRLRREKARTQGTQRALYARSGVTSEGSPLEVMADTASQYELDAQITDYNSKIKKMQLQSQADQYRKLSKSLKTQGSISLFTGIMGLSSIVGGASGSTSATPKLDTNGGAGSFIQTSSGGGYRK